MQMYTSLTRNIVALAAFILHLIITTSLFAQNESPLFPIETKGKWGFINQQGKVIIKPVFKNVGTFSYGLAPARLQGRYGYIDRKGKYKIPPIYDSGTSFVNGLAFVHIDGKKFLIDTTGAILFQHDYKDIECADAACRTGLFIVTTQSNNLGIINKKGDRIVDTLYMRIYKYSDERAVVVRNYENVEMDDYTTDLDKPAVVDINGNFIVPIGEYLDIKPFSEGVAKVEFNNSVYEEFGFIDTTGKLLFALSGYGYDVIDYQNAAFKNGVLPIRILERDSLQFKVSSSSPLYKGFLNTEGKIVTGDTILTQKFIIIRAPSLPYANCTYGLLYKDGSITPLDKNINSVEPFSDNRAFVKTTNNDFMVIDNQGKVINKNNLSVYSKKGFKNGFIVAEVREGLVPIDTMGNYLYAPQDIYRSYTLKDSFLFFLRHSDEKEKYLWGFWDLKANNLIQERFDAILSCDGFQNGLVYVMEDSIKGYVNRKGEYIWRAKRKESKLEKVIDTEFMLRGGFAAASPYKKEFDGFGGWGHSNNVSKKLMKTEKGKHSLFYIEIRKKEREKYPDQYKGYAFYVVNTSPDTIVFDAQDSWLYMTIQAVDEKGNWKPIQYIPGSWCGNSYHQLFLAQDEYWKFTMPKIKGAQKTRLRLALKYKDPTTKEDKYVYSNAIKASINPSQFWKKQEYSPTNLMDPYEE